MRFAPWFVAWARDYVEADEPPPTPEPESIRSRIDALGWVAPRMKREPLRRSGRLRKAIEWIRGTRG